MKNVTPKNNKGGCGLLAGIFLLALTLIGAGLAAHWTFNRVYVQPGQSLMLRYKGPIVFGAKNSALPGHLAKPGEIGIQEHLLGPGRHFYCPIWWERTVVPDAVVSPGEVAVVTSKLGEQLPKGEFLVDGDLGTTTQKGILRRVCTPGRYRVHPYAYEVKIIGTQQEDVGGEVKTSGWVKIPTGYVGVVTYLTGNAHENRKAGIQEDVLVPGLYCVNPRERQIDIVEIGYIETSLVVDQVLKNGKPVLDESGEPMPVLETGINFPSNDGFEIQMDFTAIWGVMPSAAPEVVRTFGNIDSIRDKVILPQSESICRNAGSGYGAVELLVGDSRQLFQNEITAQFEATLKAKNLNLLYGLVRHIYIPRDVRLPIQNSFIADELTLTRDQQRETAKTEANLREAERNVELEAQRIAADTEKLEANIMAEGEKEAQQIAAEAKQLVAAVDREIAELQAKRNILLGRAEADGLKLQEEAKAGKFMLAVQAFGNSAAYTQWQFAEGLPAEIELKLLYAGEGTLWTDLDSLVPTLPIERKKAKQ